jgi:hypothetical protein
VVTGSDDSVSLGDVDGDGTGYLRRNLVGQARLAALGARLGRGDLPTHLSGGWTAGAVFAHLAFWDRFVLARWDAYGRTGVIEDLPDSQLDLVNAGGLPLWLALDSGAAVAEAIRASADVCAHIAGLSPGAVDAAIRSGRLAMLDRGVHWSPHLDELEAAGGPSYPAAS